MSRPASPRPGRELAFLLLCHLESYDPEERASALELALESARVDGGIEGAQQSLRELLVDANARRFARKHVGAFVSDGASVDDAITAASRKWRLERMDRVDRNVLRLGAVELGGEGTPTGVVIAECVRLADRYGSERSASFVNGLLDSLARQLRPESARRG